MGLFDMIRKRRQERRTIYRLSELLAMEEEKQRAREKARADRAYKLRSFKRLFGCFGLSDGDMSDRHGSSGMHVHSRHAQSSDPAQDNDSLWCHKIKPSSSSDAMRLRAEINMLSHIDFCKEDPNTTSIWSAEDVTVVQTEPSVGCLPDIEDDLSFSSLDHLWPRNLSSCSLSSSVDVTHMEASTSDYSLSSLSSLSLSDVDDDDDDDDDSLFNVTRLSHNDDIDQFVYSVSVVPCIGAVLAFTDTDC